MKKCSIMIVVFILLFLFGCASDKNVTTRPKDPIAPVIKSQEKVKEIDRELRSVSESLKNSSISIDSEVQYIFGHTGIIEKEADNIKVISGEISTYIAVPYFESLNKSVDSIKTQNEKIKESNQKIEKENMANRERQAKIDNVRNVSIALLTRSLNEANENIKLLQKDYANLTKKNEELNKEIVSLKEENKKLFNQLMALVGFLGVLAIIAGGAIFLFSNGSRGRIAMFVSGTGVIATIVSLSILYYAKTLATIGFIILGLAIAAICASIIWQVIQSRKQKISIEKEKEKLEKAFEESVTTVEMIKPKLEDSDRKEIFGEGASPGKAHLVQSDETIGLVNKVRNSKKPLWEKTVNVENKKT